MTQERNRIVIERNSAIPLYNQLALTLAEEIGKGAFRADGGKLPSESELCRQYEVSRITVRQALTLLAQKDLVVSVHGKGTFVKSPTIGNDLQQIVSFSKLLQLKGLTGFTKVHGFEENSSSEAAQAVFSGEVSKLSLLGYASDHPVVYYYSYFPSSLGKRMLEAAVQAEKRGNAFSTYDLYADLKTTPLSVEQTLSAVNATGELEELLDLSAKKALMKIESVYYDAEHRPMEVKTAYYHSDMYSFRLRRNIIGG